jgi:hypothetical protein
VWFDCTFYHNVGLAPATIGHERLCSTSILCFEFGRLRHQFDFSWPVTPDETNESPLLYFTRSIVAYDNN